MNIRATAVVLGVGFGLAAPFLKKRIKPIGMYAFAGGVIAYEAVCEAVDFTSDTISKFTRRAGKPFSFRHANETAEDISDRESC